MSEPEPREPTPSLSGSRRLSRRIETFYRTSYRKQLDLTALADTKANIMISVNGLMISVLFAAAASVWGTFVPLRGPVLALIVTCLASIVFALQSVRPRLSDVRVTRRNPLFFGDYVDLTADEHVAEMEELLADSDRLSEAMTRELHALGLVLDRKFRLLGYSYNVFTAGIVTSAALLAVMMLRG